MRKQNETKTKEKEKEKRAKNNKIVGLDYTINFKVTIPGGTPTQAEDTLAISRHIISGLEIVSSSVRGIKLEQSQGYNTEPVAIPILERTEGV